MTNPCSLAKRIRAGQNHLHARKRQQRSQDERVEEVERSIIAAQKSLEQHRAKVEDVEKGISRANVPAGTFAQKKQRPKRPTEPRPRRRESCSQRGSPSTCFKRRRFPSKGLQTSLKKSSKQLRRGMEIGEFGGLHEKDELVTEARIQANIHELVQAQTRGDPERLARLAITNGQGSQFPGPKEEAKANGDTTGRRVCPISAASCTTCWYSR